MKFSIPAGGARVERIITASRGPGIALCTAAQAADIATRRIGGSLEDAGNGRIDADGHDQRQRLRRDTAVHGRGRCSYTVEIAFDVGDAKVSGEQSLAVKTLQNGTDARPVDDLKDEQVRLRFHRKIKGQFQLQLRCGREVSVNQLRINHHWV